VLINERFFGWRTFSCLCSQVSNLRKLFFSLKRIARYYRNYSTKRLMPLFH